jgi:hypothetical protein
MTSHAIYAAIALGIVAALPLRTAAQNKPSTDYAPAATPTVTADYPRDRAGVLMQSTDWVSIPSEVPTKTHVKHGLAPALTYGIAPAEAVSDYEGLHARVQIEPGRPVICLCHTLALPGNPVLVRLHPKKDVRQLDGGNLHIRAKLAEAEKTDLIPVNASPSRRTRCGLSSRSKLWQRVNMR